MHEPIPSCFRGRAAGAPPPSTVAGPRLTTSSYVTQLGLTVLTWSRTVFGLSLRIDLRLAPSVVGGGGNSLDADEEPIRLRVRPWLLWKRRGSKRIHLHDVDRRRTVDVVWDLTRARFPTGGGPEPAAGFFVAVAVDGDMLVAAGDMCDEAYKKTKSSQRWAAPVLISRKEHVSLVSGQGQSAYKTTAVFEGKQQEIAIEIGSATKESSMSVSVNNVRMLQVRRLRWKFRGSERVELEGGGRIQISWDLHNWLFKQPKEEAPPSSGGRAATATEHAVFVFRFEREGQKGSEEGNFGKRELHGQIGYCNWSESSSGGERRRKKSLVKTGSSSSSSSASSMSGSTVMDWASAEEAELRSAGCLFAEMFVGRAILPGRTEVEQLHRIFKLCGSPPEDYWKKLKLQTSFRPPQSYKPSISERFRGFPSSSLGLLTTLLALEPSYRGSAASALRNEFFSTSPLACDLSGLPVSYKGNDGSNQHRDWRRKRLRQRLSGQNVQRETDSMVEVDYGSSKEEKAIVLPRSESVSSPVSNTSPINDERYYGSPHSSTVSPVGTPIHEPPRRSESQLLATRKGRNFLPLGSDYRERLRGKEDVELVEHPHGIGKRTTSRSAFPRFYEQTSNDMSFAD